MSNDTHIDFEDTPETATSPFQRALNEYVRSKREKSKGSKLPQFIAELQASENPWTKTDVHNAISQLEREHSSQRSVKIVRASLKPVIHLLSDYSSVLDTLAQADPMPTSLIWGSLRAAISCSTRFLELYDLIPKQLEALGIHLARLTEFEELFSESSNMQLLLEKSYINIIRFWYRAEKECKRRIANRALRSLSSFSTSKLQGIVEDIERDASHVSALVPIVQERINRGEREDAAEERRLAGLARGQQAAMFEIYLAERKVNHLKNVREWLQCGPAPLNESNARHHEDNVNCRSLNTCLWLPTHEAFSKWVGDSSDTKLWLRADPGVGKSVLCSFAINHVAMLVPESCCIYHYYSFDEEFTPLQVCRNLAAQLVDCLWSKSQDIPEEMYNYTLNSGGCVDIEKATAIIRMIVARFPKTYVFLDGLDEECENDQRWSRLKEILKFLEGLPLIRLWCSSQDRARLRSALEGFTCIEVKKDLNYHDIKSCLSRRISELEALEIDESYRARILDNLLEKADGCFLWVSLMLDSIADARTLPHVDQKIQEELPENYEVYYKRKMANIKPSERKVTCILLACIVYARRPLRLDELREATAAADAEDGSAIDMSNKLFRNVVLRLCEPLVKVQTTQGSPTAASMCTLTHASVQKFLLKNADILTLNSSDDRSGCQIREEVMADICLKYLWQPSYRRLLKQEEDTYLDANGDDVLNQHLLPYAAKYWDKHLDGSSGHQSPAGCGDPKSLCSRVTRFIQSPQFLTCLQIQSLLVEGQFQFWFSAGRRSLGPHIKRVFPQWLAEECHPRLAQEYVSFVGEWGYLLDKICSSRGPLPGEIDRCFWQTLGPQHFLRQGSSRYHSFMLSKTHRVDSDGYRRYFESVNETGDSMVILELEDELNSDSYLQFNCSTWKLEGLDPQLIKIQKISLTNHTWLLYEYPGFEKVPGRSPPFDLTHDLRFLRLGSQIFVKSSQGEYKALSLAKAERYIQEVTSRGPYLAISRRSTTSDIKLDVPEGNDGMLHNDDYAEILAPKFGPQKLEEEPIGTSSNTTSRSEPIRQPEASSQISISNNQEQNVQKESSSGKTEVGIDGNSESEGLSESDLEDYFVESEEGERSHLSLEDSVAESDANSAAMSWSEGSTQATSELDDDTWNDWNDWHEKDQVLEDLNDSSGHSASESELDIESQSSLSTDDGIVINGAAVNLQYRQERLRRSRSLFSGLNRHKFRGNYLGKARFGDNESDGLESHWSGSYLSSSEDEESDSENEGGGRLDDLLSGDRKASGSKTQSITVQVFDTRAEAKDIPLVFHFSHTTARSLYASPPVFHPTKPLLVWPLGNDEILFADVSTNTYFTRLLSCTTYSSCHVFIKAHFSPDGAYLHFAALEASQIDTVQDPKSDKPNIRLNLQVTTHRLSQRKTTRAPPRIIFRTNVSLGKKTRLNVSSLPYSLTWRAKELYLTERSSKLNVIRIPLFAPPSGSSSTTPVYYTQAPVYLPRTALVRTVHFFPPNEEEAEKGRKSTWRRDKAMVLIGSYSSTPMQGFFVPKVEVSPPIGVFLDMERDLGGWEYKPNAELKAEGNVAGVNRGSGRLQGMFEAFDKKEDCDIVPYLF